MKIFGDYHTHTVYSHGKGTIRDNVESAIKKGLKEIAICDHGPDHMFFGVKKENFKKMRQEIDELNDEYKNIKILLGVEANVISFEGEIDVDDEILRLIDILLVGFHFGSRPKTLKDAYNMYIFNKVLSKSRIIRKKSRYLNTKALINAINNYNIDLITHPGAKVNIDTIELARAAVKRGTALEINSSHGYLTVDGIKAAMNENVNFMINSDAHTKERVGDVQSGINRAIEAGLNKNQIINIEK
ncbi:PHP domain-containing protein [Gottschalkia acidurici 9a]|uniref:PHP domain-containing protein n=1 Tax=Gottschalkia acidurici (strain ATCC 7906 / DSM 604 / BCRC 14475 / CIP 104303 / KCTC 5404 / NCIMB 10678 / 9a) TaxID=1128398 RepID=K0B1P3_GOTA9|nr:PHP domain-containing protein [Gottschalkia acidurici]AFS79032.1 PHP domain-containing protein [Gottschalkia acidurici 9a]